MPSIRITLINLGDLAMSKGITKDMSLNYPRDFSDLNMQVKRFSILNTSVYIVKSHLRMILERIINGLNYKYIRSFTHKLNV